MSAPTKYQIEARKKAERALRLIEQAQNLVADACSELSSVLYAAPEWDRVGKEHGRINALWHRVNGLLRGKWEKLDLDEMGRARLDRESGPK
jgi:hypothetical protein